MPDNEFRRFPNSLPVLPRSAEWRQSTSESWLGKWAARFYFLQKPRSEPLKQVDRALQLYEWESANYLEWYGKYESRLKRVKHDASAEDRREIETLAQDVREHLLAVSDACAYVQRRVENWEQQKEYLRERVAATGGVSKNQLTKRSRDGATTALDSSLASAAARFNSDEFATAFQAGAPARLPNSSPNAQHSPLPKVVSFIPPQRPSVGERGRSAHSRRGRHP